MEPPVGPVGGRLSGSSGRASAKRGHSHLWVRLAASNRIDADLLLTYLTDRQAIWRIRSEGVVGRVGHALS